MQLCRAEDGEVFQVNATLWDIERLGSLELFLQQETGVEQDAVLAYLSDGRRLRNDNVRELAGAHDQSIFVFNKYYLDEDLKEVLRELHVKPPLQPPIEDTITATPPFRPSQLGASYLRAAHTHHQAIAHIFVTLQYQHSALRIASNSLDLNVLAISDAFDGISANAQRELDKQAALLAGISVDLEMVTRVNIHRDFVSSAVRRAMDAGERGRTLGDYVSSVKMRQVAGTCENTHEDLKERFRKAQETMSRLLDGTAEVRSILLNIHLLNEGETISQRSSENYDRTSDAAAILERPATDPDRILQELRQLDAAMRSAVESISDVKNAFTEQCLLALRQISLLNKDVVQLPPMMTALQASFRAKNSFSHIQRLHNMLYAYGATVIEIVRRKEFARFFYQRAQVILEVMAKLSASERKRRQVYRGEIHGQLPFDTKGIDDPVPAIDFSPTGGSDLESPYSLERSDVEDFLHILDELETYAHTRTDGTIALNFILETRTSLHKLIAKMDGLESGFDRIAERSLLSSSRLALSRRRSSEIDEHAYQELVDQLRLSEKSKADQEMLFTEERNKLQSEISRLKSVLEEIDGNSSGERERADHLERELHQARAQIESETTARRIMEERHRELLTDIDNQRRELTQALAEATCQTRTAEILRQQLAQARSEFEDVKTLEARNVENMTKLLEDQEETLRNLENARSRGEDLEAQIGAARKEAEEVQRALEDARREKDRLLRQQASEHDRQMRDYVAEADGDRAVLEHQFLELRAELEDTERQLKEAASQIEMREADNVGLREELQRVECDLRDAQHIESALREDLRVGQVSQSGFEQKVEEGSRLVAQLLDVAIAYRTAHFKALTLAQAAISHPSASKSGAHLGDSQAFSSLSRLAPLGPLDEPSPIDPSDPTVAIEALRSFDHDQFLEAISKTGSTIRKWQKQCKEYRERAKGKISFRNFAKGDLALFLPTRNSVSKPWAAFNVSFPHYFLQANGYLAEQLKTREWIVARITSITERVVDQKDPSSNPYGLGDGVKYYMLEVEDWTQSSSSKRRVGSRRASSETKESTPVPLSAPPTFSPSPPQNEVEEAFQATRAPNSQLFPVVRARANSIPTAGPSSLSRLLAQAGSELPPLEPIPPSPAEPTRTPSPIAAATTSPPAHSPPAQQLRGHIAGAPSPLRPGSRASRLSTSSRFSSGRMPPFGSASSGATVGLVKAAPTTALSASPGTIEGEEEPSTPSPAESSGEGMSNMFLARRRTTSYHIQPTTRSPLGSSALEDRAPGSGPLASIASWVGRRRRTNMSFDVSAGDPSTVIGEQTSARDLLQRF